MTEVNYEADALVRPCVQCGARVPFDYTVADDFWDCYVPKYWRADVLCLPCLDLLAGRAGGNVIKAIRVVYFSGRGGTIPLVPVARPVVERGKEHP